jgi:Glycosyl transferase family 11
MILGELRPSERAVDEASRFEDLLSLPSSTALHVRRGDYTSGWSFHRPCPSSYYEQALALLQEDVPNATLLVFSDDIEWCRRNLRLDADMHFMEGNPDWLDMAVMSLCQYHICANSSFSWWGALMSKDASPIVPWLSNVSPETFRVARPAHWREIEVALD